MKRLKVTVLSGTFHAGSIVALYNRHIYTYLYAPTCPRYVGFAGIRVGLLDEVRLLCVVGPLGLSELQLIQIGKCQPHGADPSLRSSAMVSTCIIPSWLDRRLSRK